MNQLSRQNAKSQKGFHRLLNNANFGYNCRNNANNRFFAQVFEEIEELSYVEKYQNRFDPEIMDFVSTELLESQVEESYSKKLVWLHQNEEFYDAKKNSLKIKRKREIDGVLSKKLTKRQGTKESSVLDLEKKKKEMETNTKTKTIIELNQNLSCRVKCLAVKKCKRKADQQVLQQQNAYVCKNLLD